MENNTNKPAPGNEQVNRPNHYQILPGVEVRDIIRALGWGEGFNLGSAAKYLLRAGRKGDAVTDLKKAVNCIQDHIRVLEAVNCIQDHTRVLEADVPRTVEERIVDKLNEKYSDTQCEREQDSLRKQADGLRKRADGLLNEIMIRDREVSRLNDTLRSTRDALRTHVADLSDAHLRLNVLEHQNGSLARKNVELKQINERIKQVNERLDREVRELVEKNTAPLEPLEYRASPGQAELEVARHELGAARHELDMLRDSRKAERNSWLRQLESRNVERGDLWNTIQKGEARERTLEKELEDLRKAKDVVITTLAVKNKDLARRLQFINERACNLLQSPEMPSHSSSSTCPRCAVQNIRTASDVKNIAADHADAVGSGISTPAPEGQESPKG